MSIELRSVLFRSPRLCCKFCYLQNSFKVLIAFCVALFVDFFPVSIVHFLLLLGLESVSSPWRRKKIIFLTRLDTNLLWFLGARPDHVRVESSSCCFPRELDCFDPWHVTRSCPIKKGLWVGRYNNTSYYYIAFENEESFLFEWLKCARSKELSLSIRIFDVCTKVLLKFLYQYYHLSL